MASLTDREVTIGDTTFVIEPMPALAAHELFEEIWDELGLKLEAGLAQDMAAGVVVAAAGQDNDIVDVSFLAIPALAEIINKVLQVRRPFKVRLRGKLFQHVRFHNDRSGDAATAGGLGDQRLPETARRRRHGADGAVPGGKFYRVLGVRRFHPPQARSPGYRPVATLSINPSFAAIIAAGMCSYIDLRDKLSLDEALTAIEILATTRENEHRAYEHARNQSGQS